MQEEIFKDIPDYEGLYQVSNLGNVKSLEGKVFRRNGIFHFTKKEKILKKSIAIDGYYVVNLSKDFKNKTFKIHQLVAITFLNHKPCGFKIVVDHINNNKLDNRLENLQLISNRENSSKEARGKSKYTGVCWDKSKNKWKSAIRINGKTINLGVFKDEYDAHLAYQNKLKEINETY